MSPSGFSSGFNRLKSTLCGKVFALGSWKSTKIFSSVCTSETPLTSSSLLELISQSISFLAILWKLVSFFISSRFGPKLFKLYFGVWEDLPSKLVSWIEERSRCTSILTSPCESTNFSGKDAWGSMTFPGFYCLLVATKVSITRFFGKSRT